jgi:hypothetical protein
MVDSKASRLTVIQTLESHQAHRRDLSKSRIGELDVGEDMCWAIESAKCPTPLVFWCSITDACVDLGIRDIDCAAWRFPQSARAHVHRARRR